MSKFNDITGKRFGRLTVISSTKERKRGSVVWKCKCDCGQITYVSSLNLVGVSTQSCGCIRKELLKSGIIRRTHGKRKHPLYWVWTTMKSRCLNPRNKKYYRYGGRGIKVCDKWMKFENFYYDMKDTYERGLSIDRINNDGNYELSNCRWTTQKIQQNNRSNNK